MKTRAGPGRDLELRCRAYSQGELFQMNLRGFRKRGGNLLFIPEIVRSRWRVCAAMALVHFRRSSQMLLGGLAQSLRLIQKNNRPKRAFRQFKDRKSVVEGR